MINSDVREILNFLRTVTVKNTAFADIEAEAYAQRTEVASVADEDNPYYKRLAGEYTEDDAPIVVTSIDTLNDIVLHKDLALTHPKTFAAYKLPGTDFFELCKRYPNYDLVKAILYPIPSKAAAIAAVDYSVLGYDASLLHINERVSMLQVLESVASLFRTRWVIRELEFEYYYPHALWGAFWNCLMFSMIVQRFVNIRTPSVHSTHIWEYLKSHGLGDYRAVLTDSQQLFLYRNLRYILNNRGKQSNLELLSDNLLKQYGVAINTKSLVLGTENAADNCELTPKFISEDIKDNTTALQNSSNENFTVESIAQRELDNGLIEDLVPGYTEDQTRIFRRGKQTYLPTKLMELNKVARYNRYENVYLEMLLHSLVYRWSEGLITHTAQVHLPLSGLNRVYDVGECIALMHYLVYKATGHIGCECGRVRDNGVSCSECNTIARVISQAPTTIPTRQRIRLAFSRYVPVIPEYFSHRGVKHMVNSYVHLQEWINEVDFNSRTITSTRDLVIEIDRQFSVFKRDVEYQRFHHDTTYLETVNHLHRHSLKREMMDVDLVLGQTLYTEWFRFDEGLETEFMLTERSDSAIKLYRDLFIDLFVGITGYTSSVHVDNAGLKDEQYTLMKQLFIQLCSANIAFLEADRASVDYHSLNPIVIRTVGDECGFDSRIFTDKNVTITTASVTPFKVPRVSPVGMRIGKVEHTTGVKSRVPVVRSDIEGNSSFTVKPKLSGGLSSRNVLQVTHGFSLMGTFPVVSENLAAPLISPFGEGMYVQTTNSKIGELTIESTSHTFTYEDGSVSTQMITPAKNFGSNAPREHILTGENITAFRLNSSESGGYIDATIKFMENLQYLDMNCCYLKGPIPPELGEVTTLKTLILNLNSFNSPLPSNFNNLVNLITLNLASATITGPLPDFAGMTQLQSMILDSNVNIAQWPNSTIAECTALKTLSMVNCGLSGVIPEHILTLSGAEMLQFTNNLFTVSDIEGIIDRIGTVKASMRSNVYVKLSSSVIDNINTALSQEYKDKITAINASSVRLEIL